MNNNMIIAVKVNENKVILTINRKANIDGFVKCITDYNPDAQVNIYNPNYDNVPFELLPDSIQAEVKETLGAFDSCHVEHCHNKLSVHTGWCISSSYADDECVVGEYKAKEIYTPEELKEAHKRVFGYAF